MPKVIYKINIYHNWSREGELTIMKNAQQHCQNIPELTLRVIFREKRIITKFAMFYNQYKKNDVKIISILKNIPILRVHKL